MQQHPHHLHLPFACRPVQRAPSVRSLWVLLRDTALSHPPVRACRPSQRLPSHIHLSPRPAPATASPACPYYSGPRSTTSPSLPSQMQVAHQGDRVRSADQHAVSQPNREALTQRLLTLSHSMDMLLLQRHVEGMLCTGGVARERPAERVEKRLDRRRLPAECHGGACCLPGCGHWVEHVAALPTQQPISRQAAGVQPVVNVATVGPRFAAGVGLQGGTEAGPEGTVQACISGLGVRFR
jgi:hypothetical protein